jgi:hypothetical protein
MVTAPWREVATVSSTERPDESVAVFSTDFSILVTMAVIESRLLQGISPIIEAVNH